jgi:Na+/proline symporter/outer membrane receptor for Fe3+-dicitrate
MFSTHLLDWGIVLAYFAFLGVVWRSRIGRSSEAVEYLLAGRRITLAPLVATLVATWYGGILGVGEYSYRYGVSNWLVFGVPYYVGALLFAWWFARRAREAALFTIPDLLERHHGRAPAIAGAIAIFLTSAPAAYVLMLGTLFSAMTGLPLAACVIASAVFSLFYIHRGGMRAVVVSDLVQFVLMYVGMAVIVAFLVAQHGGLPFLQRSVPATHFTWHGGNPPSAILVWYFIALSTLVDPAFWQRAYAARDPKVARRAVLWSIVFWIVFDFMTTATGLYARALLPNLRDPVFAYPELAKITLPPFALGLFYVGMIATVMSTIDSYGFIAGATIGRDLIWRIRGEATEARVAFYSKIGLWIACAFAAVLALMNPTVIGLWHDLGSIVTPALLLPVATALAGRYRIGSTATVVAMAAPFLVSLVWVLSRKTGAEGTRYPLGIEPIYAGLVTSVVAYAAGWMIRGSRTRTVLVAGAFAVACALGIATTARAQAADTTAAAEDTLRKVVTLPEVIVSTTRADERSPFARSSLTREELARRNWGQDTPMALAALPGAYAYSDAGNGIGYSYLSIRGFPQRRISVLVNGVPLNDPESHEVYWIDHPDLLASTAEVQVQRGVGSALYGAASVGGTVSIETSPFAQERRLVAATSFGSFDTRRFLFEGDSGPLEGDWNLYGRYSRIETEGYRERSDTQLWSYFLAARKLAGAHSLRLNLYGGPEETHLAYLGVPRAVLDVNRRFNPITYEGERDHFFEPHYELIHSWRLDDWKTLTQTFFYFDGEGWYDERRFGHGLADYRLAPWATTDSTLFPRGYYRDADEDGNLDVDGQGRYTVERFDPVRRRWIANRHYGWVPRFRFQFPRGGWTTIGGELRGHDGRHIGTVTGGSALPPGVPADHDYYDYHPRTLSTGLFARQEYPLKRNLLATLDLAWRHQGYSMRGDRFDGIHFDQSYDFFLPRLGLTWTPGSNLTAFAAVAHSRREPAFRDLYDAEGAGSVPLFVNGDPLIRPERVNDYELGGEWRRGLASVSANLFHMDFRDELVYAGQFNTDLGYPILGNAARSVHQGIELAGSAAWGAPVSALGHRFGVTGNLTLSDNQFVEYRERYGPTPADEVSYDGNTIGFFPGLLANLGVDYSFGRAALGMAARHVGRIHLDHTASRDASIGPHTILDVRAGFEIEGFGTRRTALGLRVLNALDRRYETGGYMDYDAGGNLVPHFIPAATRQVLGELRVEF